MDRWRNAKLDEYENVANSKEEKWERKKEGELGKEREE